MGPEKTRQIGSPLRPSALPDSIPLLVRWRGQFAPHLHLRQQYRSAATGRDVTDGWDYHRFHRPAQKDDELRSRPTVLFYRDVAAALVHDTVDVANPSRALCPLFRGEEGLTRFDCDFFRYPVPDRTVSST